MLEKKEHKRFMQNENVIPEEFQHALVITDMDEKEIRKAVRKSCAERRRISLLKDQEVI